MGLSFFTNVLKYRESLEARALKGLIEKETSILDVGAGSGELVEALFSLGYKRIEGIEPFLQADIENDKGWKIRKAFITDLDDERKFDLIMLHHSFEHMENPKEVLEKIKVLLSPKGKCIIRIPVCDSYAFEHY